MARPRPVPPAARARFVGAVEALEHVGGDVVGHARAFVGDGEFRVIAVDRSR